MLRDTGISIIETHWSEHSDEITLIRNIVFVEEQSVPKNIEMDGKDVDCNHFLICKKNEPIGTARLQSGGKIERVSILKTERKKGLGTKLMKFIINSARKKDLEKVYLHSQMDSIDFYKSLGFKTKGRIFQEAGINHVLMVMENE
mgnify:FL=1